MPHPIRQQSDKGSGHIHGQPWRQRVPANGSPVIAVCAVAVDSPLGAHNNPRQHAANYKALAPPVPAKTPSTSAKDRSASASGLFSTQRSNFPHGPSLLRISGTNNRQRGM